MHQAFPSYSLSAHINEWSPHKQLAAELASWDQVTSKCQQQSDGVTLNDMGDLKRNVWYAANSILVSYLMSCTSTLFH